MRKIRTVMATTHIDRHNERLSHEALESMQSHIRSSYLPFIFNHDPRCPPLGRVTDAEIVTLADGEHALEADVEVFEQGPLPRLTGKRSLSLRELPNDTLLLTIDRSFSRSEFEGAIAKLADLFGGRPQFEGKKALEPIAVLIISAGGLALGAFATSFFSRLGANAADALTARLQEIFSKKRAEEVSLLRFELEFEYAGECVRAEVILTGPTDAEIDQFLSQGLCQLDKVLPTCLGQVDGLVRYVFEYSNGDLSLSFAVRRDAVPIFPTDMGLA